MTCFNKAKEVINVVSLKWLSKKTQTISKEFKPLLKEGEEQQIFFVASRKISTTIKLITCFLLLLIFLYSLFIGICVVKFSADSQLVGLLMLVVSVCFVLLDIYFVFSTVSSISIKKRLNKYKQIIGYKRYINIDEIVKVCKIKRNRVIKDLKIAPKRGLLLYANFDGDYQTAFFSEMLYENYKRNNSDLYSFSPLSGVSTLSNSRKESKSQHKMVKKSEQFLERISEQAKQLGLDSCDELFLRIKNLTVQLCDDIRNNHQFSPLFENLLSYFMQITEKFFKETLNTKTTSQSENTKSVRKLYFIMNKILFVLEYIAILIHLEYTLSLTTET